jgi:parvulin-like peptidyl-prolyl isomerase
MSFIEKRSLLIIMLIVVALLAACSQDAEGQQSENAVRDSAVVAKVDGKPIYQSDVFRRLKAASGNTIKEIQTDPARYQRLMDVATESELMDKLLLQAAARAGITVSEEEEQILLERTRKMAGASGFNKMLKEQGASEETFRTFLVDRELIGRYKEILLSELIVNDNELKEYYEGHMDAFAEPIQVRLEVFTVGGRETAIKIHSLWQGGESFDTISQKYMSEGEKIGRKTRWMPIDAVPVELQSRIVKAKAGSILDPKQVSGKFYVVRVIEKLEARTREFEKMKDEITKTLLNLRKNKILNEWYIAASQKANIEYVR